MRKEDFIEVVWSKENLACSCKSNFWHFFGKISNFSLAQFANGITFRNKILWLSMIITLSFFSLDVWVK